MLIGRLRDMKSVIVAVVCMAGTLSFETEPGHTCQNEEYPDLPLVIHTNKDGLKRCCLYIECNPGTEPRLCEDFKPDSTSCISCKPGTFQNYTIKSFYLIKCKPHTHCSTDAVVHFHGTATTDVKCICNLKLGYYGTWPECYSDKICEPGLHLMLSGTCEPCPPDSYQNMSSSRPCFNCSRCDLVTQEIYESCTAFSDTICRNKTSDDNPDVNISPEVDFRFIIIPVVLGAILVVAIVPVIILCRRKLRTGGNTGSSASFSSGSTSPSENSTEPGTALYIRDEDRSKQLVFEENLYQRCPGNTFGETESLPCSSLCPPDAIRGTPKSDFDNHVSSESEGLLNSPSEDTSFVDASVNLIDERENGTGREDSQPSSFQYGTGREDSQPSSFQYGTGREDSQPSVQYEVETEDVSADQRTDSVPFHSRDVTVMKGKCNVKQGNVYNFKNCHNINIVHRK